MRAGRVKTSIVKFLHHPRHQLMSVQRPTHHCLIDTGGWRLDEMKVVGGILSRTHNRAVEGRHQFPKL
eukprot:6463383-Amphidinium_carterae.1